MPRPPLLLLVPLALAWAGAADAALAQEASPSRPGAGPAGSVDVVKVSGALDEPLVGYLEDALSEAEANGSVVVLQLDTAGTLDQDARALARRIFEAEVPVIVWVGPAPAKASGAGLLFMYASSLAAASPGSQTGPLHPLDLAFPEREFPGLEEEVAGWIEARGKQTDLDGRDRPLTAAEARHRDIAQVAALSVPGLLERIEGREVQTAAGPVTLRTALAKSEADPRVTWEFKDLGPVKRVLHAMVSPSAIYLLLVLAFAALAFELTQPGFGFAGFGGVGMLALAVYGLTVVPFSWPGLAVLVAGVGLMVSDVRLRRLGWLTGAGLASVVAGSLLVFASVSGQIDLSPWLVGSLTAASLLYYGFGLTVAIQSRERITSSQRGLIGLVGEARGDLAPEGPVFVKGALWRGRAAEGTIEKGTTVRVRGVDGLILRVAPELEPAEPGE